MFNFNNQSNTVHNNQNNAISSGQNERELTHTNNTFETLQNARKDLMGELEAIIQYDDHLHKTNVKLAKSTWEDIRNEELVHVGELLALIFYLAPYQKELVEKGVQEFNNRMNNNQNNS